MTIREYITQKLQSVGLTESQFADFVIETGLDTEGVYTAEVATQVGTAMCSLLEEIVLSPKMSNVNEGGFSMSWDYSGLGRYYMWLCRKYGVTPNSDAVSAMGISVIKDCTDRW